MASPPRGNAMRAEGWSRLYWMTKRDNEAARRLYDRFTAADDFVRYVVRAAPPA